DRLTAKARSAPRRPHKRIPALVDFPPPQPSPYRERTPRVSLDRIGIPDARLIRRRSNHAFAFHAAGAMPARRSGAFAASDGDTPASHHREKR
ncbi:MAG: hypothetical protein D6788_03325, partial [Planctomycetota bacterium]